MHSIHSIAKWVALCFLGLTAAACLTTDIRPIQGEFGKADGTRGESLPTASSPFVGQLEPTDEASTPNYPKKRPAPAGAPNILLVMTDDAGFGAASTFGGSVPTPNLDELASDGLRYTRFHTTGVCSPTRAALLTGRNHHAVGSGAIVEMSSPYPGYTGKIPSSAATIARVLREHGYNTAMFGKDHNVPITDRSAAGPYDHWPTGRLRGFEYFYGFIAGDTHQWQPALFENTLPLDSTSRPQDALLDQDLADRAIHWLHNQKAAAPSKPFFIYLAPGSPHAPQHAPAEWIRRFQGRFDNGWDLERGNIVERQRALGIIPPNSESTPRPDFIPAWETLSEDEQRVYARFMEVFAAQLAYQDHQFGRLVDEIDRMGLRDNTLIVFIEGDNGASGEAGPHGTLNEMAHLSAGREFDIGAEWLADHLEVLGGPKTYQSYPVGWTWATSAPFPWFKQAASHLGGVRNGMVVSWPDGFGSAGEIRTQYHHVVDIVPTLLEVSGIDPPAFVDGTPQQPIDGTSFAYSFDDGRAESRRRTQYYEVNGNRGIYHEGWLANTTPRNMPWEISRQGKDSDTSTYAWELYDLRADFAQSRDISASHPSKLEEMRAIFDQEARRYDVYPIQDTGGRERARRMIRARGEFRTSYEFFGADIQLNSMSAPPIFNLPFTIEAEVVLPESGSDGVVVAAGSAFGGWSLFLNDGHAIAVASRSPLPGGHERVASSEIISPGAHTLTLQFEPRDLGGAIRLSVDGRMIAESEIGERPLVLAGNGETFDTGRDTNGLVSDEYDNHNAFGGEIRRIVVTIRPTALQKQPTIY